MARSRDQPNHGESAMARDQAQPSIDASTHGIGTSTIKRHCHEHVALECATHGGSWFRQAKKGLPGTQPLCLGLPSQDCFCRSRMSEKFWRKKPPTVKMSTKTNGCQFGPGQIICNLDENLDRPAIGSSLVDHRRVTLWVARVTPPGCDWWFCKTCQLKSSTVHTKC